MKDSDAIKFIDVASNLYDNLPVVWPDHCKIFVPQQGVDFIYDKTTRSLKIRVWYTKFLGSNPVIHTTLQLLVVNNNLPQIINEDINMWKQHVLPGISFAMHDGEKFLVVWLQDINNVICAAEYTGEEVVFSFEEAADLLRSFIG